jgi:Gas vesicle synthesis protein GvpO
MAERRRTGGTRQPRSRVRRPADQQEREVLDEDETEPMSPDDQEADEEYEEEYEEDASDAADRDGSSLSARQAARVALRQILELTDKQAESITGVERREDGWTVSIEVVEDRRIPSSADILATYETKIDEDGELMSYRRVRRYSRGRGDCS